MKNYRIIAALTGALIAAPFISGCSDNNNNSFVNGTAETEITSGDETETAPQTEEKTTEEATAAADDFGTPDEDCAQNRPQLLYILDSGDYVYSTGKDGSDDHSEVFVKDDGKGGKTTLDLPEKSLLLHTDGENIYYYSPDEGLCVYDGKKSKLLSSETKSEESVPPRERFFFTGDRIYFACDTSKGTVIKSMDYSGKNDRDEYNIEYHGARIVGNAEINGEKAFLCTYRIGIAEHVRIFTDKDSFTEVNSGDSPYIVDQWLYYIKDRALRRIPLAGGSEEKMTEAGCTCFCLYNDKIYYADSETVYAIDKNGSSSAFITTDDIGKCDFIAGISASDGRLFVSGGTGASGRSIVEVDESGKVISTISEI